MNLEFDVVVIKSNYQHDENIECFRLMVFGYVGDFFRGFWVGGCLTVVR